MESKTASSCVFGIIEIHNYPLKNDQDDKKRGVLKMTLTIYIDGIYIEIHKCAIILIRRTGTTS